MTPESVIRALRVVIAARPDDVAALELPTLEELCESPLFSDPAFQPATCP